MSKKTDTQKALHEIMVAGINAVLKGKETSFKSPENITPAMVEKFLQPLGWKRGDLDTNGWQYDWWLPFTKDGKSFTANGSGYYGGFDFFETEVP